MTRSMQDAATVALIEDDAAYRAAVADLFGRRCVGAWPTVESALPHLAAAAPAVLLLDIDLPGLPGHLAVGRLRDTSPGVDIVLLTAHDDPALLFQALRAGAVGYLLKSVDADALVEAVDEAAAGGAPMSPEIARRVVAHFAECPAPVPSPSVNVLTARERELLRWIESGLSDKEAAARLGISHGTARNSLSAIYRKLGVSGRTEVILRRHARPS